MERRYCLIFHFFSLHRVRFLLNSGATLLIVVYVTWLSSLFDVMNKMMNMLVLRCDSC